MQGAIERDGSSDGRLAILDGARGLAAAGVVLFHFSETLAPAHGYLAVDLFFLLSGYVVALAYGARLKAGASLGWFLRVRMARLYPLYLAGMVLGFVIRVRVQPDAALWGLAGGWAFLPTGLPYGAAFPANEVMWSLSLEVLASLAFALGGWRLGNRALAAVVVSSGVVMTACILHFGDANLGSVTGDYLAGFPRLLFSFPLGVLIFRLHQASRLRLWRPPGVVALAGVAAVLALPRLHPALEAATILAGFPALFLVMLGAPAPANRLAGIYVWAGRLSYPLYSLHFPILDLARGWAWTLDMPLAPIPMVLGLAAASAAAAAAHFSLEPMGRRLILGWPSRPARRVSGAARPT